MFGEVVARQELTPQLVRIVLGGPGLDDFRAPDHTDAYINAYFPPDDATYDVPFDEPSVRVLPSALRPAPRRLTVRRWDPDARRLSIDIVVHGDVGRAGRWAGRARPGDRLQLRGPAGGYVPHPDADSYLFVGDESALPAIAACAEAVPPDRPVLVVAEVQDTDGELPLHSPGELRTVWVHRSRHTLDPTVLLSEAVAAEHRPDGVVSAFVHGEAAAIRDVRRLLLAEHAVDRDRLSCSPYWRRGDTDEEWRRAKANWTREMEHDV